MRIKLALFVLVACFGVGALAQAQSRELLWRVHNLSPAEKIPPFSGEPSLFPQRTEPAKFEDPQLNAPITPVLSEEEKQERDRVRRAASLLEDIREVIQTEGVFRPDVSGIEVMGQISNENGSKVLIDNAWIGVGDPVEVPTRGVEKAIRLVEDLQMLDPQLATIVQEDIDDRLSEAEVIELSVGKIEMDYVTLVDTAGAEYVISIIPAGW